MAAPTRPAETPTPDDARERLEAWLRRTTTEALWISNQLHAHAAPFAALPREDARSLGCMIGTASDVLESLISRFQHPQPPAEFADIA